MDREIGATLLALNRAFYQKYAGDFARTRRRWPRGFARIVPHLRTASNVLDLGCGNGRLLALLLTQEWRGGYLGIDASEQLLSEARATAHMHHFVQARFEQADLSDPGWPAQVGKSGSFDAIVALAVLHHIPGTANRAHFVTESARLLLPGGRLIISTWQFLSSRRLSNRILPWEAAGLRSTDVEPGDYLLSWGQGAAGQRYCAAIGESDLLGMAEKAGLASVELFRADGHEGDLSLYGVFSAR